LEDFLRSHPELRSVFSKIDPEEEPSKYSACVSRFVEAALPCECLNHTFISAGPFTGLLQLTLNHNS